MWARILNTLAGLWLMAAPAVLGHGTVACDNNHIVGPLVAAMAIVACWEVTRSLRWLNVPPGLWLIAAPLVLEYANRIAALNSMVIGLVIATLSFVRGRRTESFGGGWRRLADVIQAEVTGVHPICGFANLAVSCGGS